MEVSVNETLLQRLELADYNAVVEAIAKAIFDRAMIERQRYSNAPHRFAVKWSEASAVQRGSWLNEAREALLPPPSPAPPEPHELLPEPDDG